MPCGGVDNQNKAGSYIPPGGNNTSYTGGPLGVIRTAKKISRQANSQAVIKEINQATYTILENDSEFSIIYPGVVKFTFPSIVDVSDTWKVKMYVFHDTLDQWNVNNAILFQGANTDKINGFYDSLIMSVKGASVRFGGFYNQLNWRMI